jgi:hypothetical protein
MPSKIPFRCKVRLNQNEGEIKLKWQKGCQEDNDNMAQFIKI